MHLEWSPQRVEGTSSEKPLVTNTLRCASEPPTPFAGPETPRRYVCLEGVGDVRSSFSIIPIRLHKKTTVSFYLKKIIYFFIDV